MPKYSTTIVAEVHALLVERFNNGREFTSRDVLDVAPWLASEHPQAPINRVSAALSQLCRYGGIKKTRKKGLCNYWVVDKEVLGSWTPKLSHFPLGYHKTRAARTKPVAPRRVLVDGIPGNNPETGRVVQLNDIMSELYDLKERTLEITMELEALWNRLLRFNRKFGN